MIAIGESIGMSEWVVVHGIRLHCVVAGTGPTVILLHGFPEFWYSWRRQIPALVDAGFRVVAPDLRGYNLSDKPPGIESYRLDALTADVAGLIQHFGNGSAAIVGHDWGGVIAWSLAMQHPELVKRLCILNAPHPAAYLREVRRLGQLIRSWYALFFQIPRLPEALIRAGNFWVIGRSLRLGPARPEAFTEADIRQYKKAMAQPGALTAGINYYRASFRHLGQATGGFRSIAAPTLLIWGLQDRFLTPRLTRGLEVWVPNLRVETIPHAAHWVQNEAPEDTNRLLIGFLKSQDVLPSAL